MVGRPFQRAMVSVLALAVTTDTAAADETLVRADQLFEEAKAMVDKDLAGGCAKFEESLRLNSQAIGTLLNVALCDEKLGRYASAVAKFTEARDRAKEQGMDVHRQAAEDHLQGLAGKVPHITLTFSEPPLAQTTIVIDHKLISFASIANHPVDPGGHDVVVSAPGHMSYKARFEVTAGETIDLPIPRLEKSITLPSSRRRTIGKITTATGAAVVGIGTVVGLVADRRYSEALDHCNQIMVDTKPRWQCDRTGFNATRAALKLGDVATVVWVSGLATVGVGAYLWLRGPTEQRVSVIPQVGSDGVGLAAVGRF